jgi:hypothetical protein
VLGQGEDAEAHQRGDIGDGEDDACEELDMSVSVVIAERDGV